MAKDRTSVGVQAKIKKMFELGYSIHSIARNLKISRKTVRKYLGILPQETSQSPGLIQAVNWDYVLQKVLSGGRTTIKQIHREIAPEVSYLNFWRVFRAQVLRKAAVSQVAIRLHQSCARLVERRERDILLQWRQSTDRTRWGKAVTILDNHSHTVKQIAIKIEKSIDVVKNWISAFNRQGIEGLNPQPKRREDKRSFHAEAKAKRVLEILHQRPNAFGINRSNWNQATLALAYEREHGGAISKSTVSRLIRKSGHRWKKAKRVLSSPDPRYREKVELLLNTLHNLRSGELFFFVDELGPLRIKRYGGRVYVPQNTSPTVPQVQPHRGAVILAAALSATTNQVTWIYENSKDTLGMIDLAELLFNQHHDATRIFLTWDSASWHRSDALSDWLDRFNSETRVRDYGPVVELVPLPTSSQFLNVLEAVFSGMKRAVIHNSDYRTTEEMKRAISRHFSERNAYFKENPKRAGKKIWEIDFFADIDNLTAGNYREW
jgi:transposase